MKTDRKTLTLAIFLVIALVLTVLVYSSDISSFTNTSYNTTKQLSANSIKVNDFLDYYNLSNDSNLFVLYNSSGNLDTENLVVNCNREFTPLPVFNLSGSLPGVGNLSYYLNKTQENALNNLNSINEKINEYTVCSIYNSTACGAIKQQLYSLFINNTDYAYTSELYNFTKYEFETLYNSSIVQSVNGSDLYNLLSGVRDDINLLNSTSNSTASMLSALINITQLEQEVISMPNGTLVKGIYITGPFQNLVYYFPQIKPCNSTINIFNFIPNENVYDPFAYKYMFSTLGANVTNICIDTASNNCTSAKPDVNASFYV